MQGCIWWRNGTEMSKHEPQMDSRDKLFVLLRKQVYFHELVKKRSLAEGHVRPVVKNCVLWALKNCILQ